MIKKNNIFFLIFIITSIVIVIILLGINRNKRKGSVGDVFLINDTSATDIPFTYQLPAGWRDKKQEIEMNALPGGGPMQALYVLSPNLEKDFPEFSDPSISIYWFNFNPQATFKDIVELMGYSPKNTLIMEPVQLTDRAAYRVVHILRNSDVSDGEPPAYRTEIYLTRLPDQRLLQIRIDYNHSENFEKYKNVIQEFIDSIKIKK